MCAIIWHPAPLKSCYLARHLKEVARACIGEKKMLYIEIIVNEMIIGINKSRPLDRKTSHAAVKKPVVF